jgi:hypothetical protein
MRVGLPCRRVTLFKPYKVNGDLVRNILILSLLLVADFRLGFKKYLKSHSGKAFAKNASGKNS